MACAVVILVNFSYTLNLSFADKIDGRVTRYTLQPQISETPCLFVLKRQLLNIALLKFGNFYRSSGVELAPKT